MRTIFDICQHYRKNNNNVHISDTSKWHLNIGYYIYWAGGHFRKYYERINCNILKPQRVRDEMYANGSWQRAKLDVGVLWNTLQSLGVNRLIVMKMKMNLMSFDHSLHVWYVASGALCAPLLFNFISSSVTSISLSFYSHLRSIYISNGGITFASIFVNMPSVTLSMLTV